LTSGPRVESELKIRFNNKLPIKTLGSSKYLLNNDFQNSSDKGILFIPCGNWEETIPMASIALSLSNQLPFVDIIFRLHPLLTKGNLFKRFPILSNHPHNFIISQSSLRDDSVKSKLAIYLVSSAIFESVQYGCIPCRLELLNCQNLSDPLWMIRNLGVFSASNSDELLNLYNHISSSQFSISKHDYQYNLIRGLESLVSKLEPDVLFNILSNNHI